MSLQLQVDKTTGIVMAYGGPLPAAEGTYIYDVPQKDEDGVRQALALRGTKILNNDGSLVLDQTSAVAADQAQVDDTTQTTRWQGAVSAARPALTILQKLKDGTALTAPEMQQVVRWLALRELREVFR
jgi:hypothetical protein